MITTCISTFNTLPYLKLAIHSVRKYSHFKDMPFVIHAENCTDGTDEWLEQNKDRYNLEVYIEHNDTPRGIGGGMNFCASKVKTEFINFMHSDFFVSSDWDLNLYKVFEIMGKFTSDGTRYVQQSRGASGNYYCTER
jgi:glycosyltransferase involved in cell wall biosynthesis